MSDRALLDAFLDRLQSKAGVVEVTLGWHRDRALPFSCCVSWYDEGDEDGEDELEQGDFWGTTRLEAVRRAAKWLGVAL